VTPGTHRISGPETVVDTCGVCTTCSPTPTRPGRPPRRSSRSRGRGGGRSHAPLAGSPSTRPSAGRQTDDLPRRLQLGTSRPATGPVTCTDGGGGEGGGGGGGGAITGDGTGDAPAATAAATAPAAPESHRPIRTDFHPGRDVLIQL
jgi:hypothetical protein